MPQRRCGSAVRSRGLMSRLDTPAATPEGVAKRKSSAPWHKSAQKDAVAVADTGQ
jgi:hypothetical protein